MTRKLLITSIVMLVVGIIARIYANNYTYIDADGVLRDTAWLPISALLLLVGVLLLVISIVIYSVGYLKSR